MRLGGIAAHHHNHVGMLDVDKGVGHRAAAEGGGQCRHGGAVAHARLRIGGHDAERAHPFLGENTGFIR